MGTALSYYELTSWTPPDIHIALPRGRKIVLSAYPPVKIYHVSEAVFNLGCVEIEMENTKKIRIYDRERAVCDAVRFRNKNRY
jgi:predicted transcriptional regulator of viral defense system